MGGDYELTDRDRLAIAVAGILRADGSETAAAEQLGEAGGKEYRRQTARVAAFASRTAAADADPRLVPGHPGFLDALHEHYPRFLGGRDDG